MSNVCTSGHFNANCLVLISVLMVHLTILLVDLGSDDIMTSYNIIWSLIWCEN